MSENNIKIFTNDNFGSVRTVLIDDEPYFVGKEVAKILGYSNSSKAVSSHVDEEDKRFIMINIADSQNGNVPTGKTKTAIINESGLYSLIFSSKLPKAKEFKHWVTSEVLPQSARLADMSAAKIYLSIHIYLLQMIIQRHYSAQLFQLLLSSITR